MNAPLAGSGASETQLRTELDRASGLLGAVPKCSEISLITLDRAEKVTNMNQFAFNLIGSTAAAENYWHARQISGSGGLPIPSLKSCLEDRSKNPSNEAEWSITTQSGALVELSITAIPLTDQNGEFDGCVLVGRSLSDKRETGHFTWQFSHETRPSATPNLSRFCFCWPIGQITQESSLYWE